MTNRSAGTSGGVDSGRRGGKLTRRQVLISSGTAAGSLIVLQGVEAVIAAREAEPITGVSESPPPFLRGVIEGVALPNTLTVRTGKGSAAVYLASGATIRRGPGGREQDLAAFMPGDEVVAIGAWGTGAYSATSLVSLFRPIVGRILQRTGGTIQIPGGAIHLTTETSLVDGPGFVAKSIAQLVAGDELVGSAWWDPVQSMLVAARIGVPQRS